MALRSIKTSNRVYLFNMLIVCVTVKTLGSVLLAVATIFVPTSFIFFSFFYFGFAEFLFILFFIHIDVLLSCNPELKSRLWTEFSR